LLEGGERGLYERNGVIRAEAFSKDIVNASRFADGADGGAGDNTSTGRSRKQNDVSGAVMPFDDMRNGFAIERNGDQAAHAFFASFFDGGRHFICFAVAPANFALAIADNDHRGEAKATTTLHNGSAALDLNDGFRKLALDALATIAAMATAAPAPLTSIATTLAATARAAGTTVAAAALATVTATTLASIASFAGTSRHISSLSKN
jgi:hypothetical protein